MGKPLKQQESYSVKGNNHIIFKKNVPKFKIELPIVTEYSLYLSEFSEKNVEISTILNELRNADEEDIIKIFINSPGGCVAEGRALINTLSYVGCDIHTELISHGYSMGALLFCVGGRRVIYENSSIMFHNYSAGVYGKGHEIEQHVTHLSKNLESFFKSVTIGLSDKEIQELLDGKDFWFDAKEMCQREIATHVMVEGLMIPAKTYLKTLKKAKKKAKKRGLKITTLQEAYLQGINVLLELAIEREKELDDISAEISEIISNHEFLYN